jgi:glycosyltransferase involved in cell wall biosynthesis
MSQKNRRVLIIVKSPITRDPRVRRQIEWMIQDDWSVDTVGPVGHHVPGVDTHFGVNHAPAWTRSQRIAPLMYALVPHGLLFRYLLENRIPKTVKQRISGNHYDLVLFNDHHFLPWIRTPAVFTSDVVRRGIHLDMHEYVAPTVRSGSWVHSLAARYNDWVRSFIGDARFASRSAVASGISHLYASEFNIPPLAVVRSAPVYVEQTPSVVDTNVIELLYHGAAHDNRGIPELLEAMETLSDRFRLTLILVGDESKSAEYRHRAESKNLRVSFAPPVPVDEITMYINKFDVEVMFFPPRTRNLEFALPNKLFEALQGRLALAMGESSMMTEVVAEYSNGVIAPGWTANDLAQTLELLTAESVTAMKANSDRAAREISAETERAAFFESIRVIND